jgi:hypothetical protein
MYVRERAPIPNTTKPAASMTRKRVGIATIARDSAGRPNIINLVVENRRLHSQRPEAARIECDPWVIWCNGDVTTVKRSSSLAGMGLQMC